MPVLLLYLVPLVSSHSEWKSKSEECDKEIQEWKKRASTATTSISKLNRQINSKVTYKFVRFALHEFKSLMCASFDFTGDTA